MEHQELRGSTVNDAGGNCAGWRRRRCTLPKYVAAVVAWIPAITAISLFAACASNPPPVERLDEAVAGRVGDVTGPVHYFFGPADLDGDRRPEWIVHVAGPMVCGTGGCNTLVFSESDGALRLVSEIPVTRPPIRVAASRSGGWRDLVVRVSGGGIIPGYDALLRYDVEAGSYPSNPTVPPARQLAAPSDAEVVIAPFETFADGRLLKP